MKRKKKQQALFRKYFRFGAIGAVVFIAVLVVLIGNGISKRNKNKEQQGVQTETAELQAVAGTEAEESLPLADQKEPAEVQAAEPEENKIYEAAESPDMKAVSEEVISSNAIFIDLRKNEILAQRAARQVIDPASMTKILTVLVAAEQIEEKNLDDKVTITIDITDYSYSNDCSSVGFAENERVTVQDLFYGTILPSGADAALALATYVAGSQEAFVELMNEKLQKLGLSDTAHFTNCVGLYDEAHRCTVYDMAMIMEAAMDNPLCREVMSAHTYTTSATAEHPDGITISNWFLRRIEDKETGAEIVCGKTGYVVQSGNCAASYGEDQNGNGYICVTADSTSAWRCIYDHVALYSEFTA
jgi:D-alanyl-D-alanine carboxypeptidase dacA1